MVDSQIRKQGRGNGQIFYKVSWKGYGPHKMSWEPIEHLNTAQQALEDFHKQYPNKPRTPALQKLKIPRKDFPFELFRPMPTPLTESILTSLPTEAMIIKAAYCGTHALKRG